MATKDDIAGIMTELADIKQRLKDVESAVKNHAGHSKEIDHAFERIAAIERISAQLDAAVEKLEKVKQVYEEKLKILSALMEEYHQLGGECSEQVKLIQSRAEDFLKQYQSNVKHVCKTVFVI